MYKALSLLFILQMKIFIQFFLFFLKTILN